MVKRRRQSAHRQNVALPCAIGQDRPIDLDQLTEARPMPPIDPYADPLTGAAIRFQVLGLLINARVASATENGTVILDQPDLAMRLLKRCSGWQDRFTETGRIKRSVVEQMQAEWRANGYIRADGV
jgi:hypothetical protein